MKEVVASLVRSALDGPAAQVAGQKEVEALVSLCLIGVHRTGKEDPRALVRSVSDPLLEHLVSSLERLRDNRALRAVSQFLLVEWCFRNGYLLDDWRWEWVDGNEGRLHYLPKIPLEDVPLPQRPQ